MSAPAGWYPQPNGRQRYWDGAQWTEHFHGEATPEVPSAGEASTPSATEVPAGTQGYGQGHGQPSRSHLVVTMNVNVALTPNAPTTPPMTPHAQPGITDAPPAAPLPARSASEAG